MYQFVASRAWLGLVSAISKITAIHSRAITDQGSLSGIFMGSSLLRLGTKQMTSQAGARANADRQMLEINVGSSGSGVMANVS